MSTWNGKTKGGLLGYKFFIFVLKRIGLKPAYFILYFVSFYYVCTSFATNKQIYFFYRRAQKFSFLQSILSVYLNYNKLGQVLIDKIAILSGANTNFKFIHQGEEKLVQLIEQKRGCILVSGHIGNWEVAAEALNHIKQTINVVMYDGEHLKIKDLMDKILTKRQVNIISIKNDFSHIYEITNALQNNEIICIHGDRFLPGTKTIDVSFFDRMASFPIGLYALAIQLEVPIGFVFCMKEKQNVYKVICEVPQQELDVKFNRNEAIGDMVKQYASSLEKISKRYPIQWFNYHDFWKTNDTKK